MRKIMLTIIVLLTIIIVFIIGSSIGIILVLFRFPSRKTYCYLARVWSKIILFMAGIKLAVKGVENLAFDGPKILISNHQGNFDIPILIAAMPVNFKFFAKKELFRIPFFGWYLRKREDLPLDRESSSGAHEALKIAAEKASKGDVLLVFPEGTRSHDGSVGKFKRGGVVLAADSGAKIIPVAISGSFEIQKRGSFWMDPADVSVNIGKPIDVPAKEKKSDKYEETLAQLRETIISLMGKK